MYSATLTKAKASFGRSSVRGKQLFKYYLCKYAEKKLGKRRNKRIFVETRRNFKNNPLLSDEDQGGCKRFLNRVLEKSMANVKFDLCGAPGADPRL